MLLFKCFLWSFSVKTSLSFPEHDWHWFFTGISSSKSIQIGGFLLTMNCLLFNKIYLIFKALSYSHEYYVWIFWCTIRFDFWEKAFPHLLHLWGFSPVCVIWCLRRCDFLMKALPHSIHPYGFSPVWILWCVTSTDVLPKALPHTIHR